MITCVKIISSRVVGLGTAASHTSGNVQGGPNYGSALIKVVGKDLPFPTGGAGSLQHVWLYVFCRSDPLEGHNFSDVRSSRFAKVLKFQPSCVGRVALFNCPAGIALSFHGPCVCLHLIREPMFSHFP